MASPSVPFPFHLGSSAAPSPSRASPAPANPSAVGSLKHLGRSPSNNMPSTSQPVAHKATSGNHDVVVKQEETEPEDPLVVALRGSHASALRNLMDIFDQAVEYRGDHSKVDSLQQEVEVWKTQYFEKAKAISAFEAENKQLREKERAATDVMLKLREEQEVCIGGVLHALDDIDRLACHRTCPSSPLCFLTATVSS